LAVTASTQMVALPAFVIAPQHDRRVSQAGAVESLV
jgi:hypothetical protein